MYLTYLMIFVGAPIIGFSADDEDLSEPSTPLRQTVSRIIAAEHKTPGQLLSQRQYEVFQRDKFVDVLGEEVVEGWNVNWECLSLSDESPHNPDKINAVRMLNNKMKFMSRTRFDEDFDKLFLKVMRIHAQMEIVHLDRLEGVVSDFFEYKFPGAKITSHPKNNGVQLGEIVNVTNDEKTKVYYVKTHSEGKLSSKSSVAKLVNPGELFTYKVLENLGFGCETHFCARSPEDVYIATLDANEGGKFREFTKAIKDEDGFGTKLWGGLGEIDMTVSEIDWHAFETSLAGDSTALGFIEQLSTVDALTRILGMNDLLNNSDNYGYWNAEDQSAFFLRIVDFRASIVKELPFTDSHFLSYLIGNGHFEYVGAHRTLAYTLRHRPVARRVETSLHTLTEGSLKQLPNAVEKAYDDVSRYFQDNSAIFGDQLKSLMDDLKLYHQAVMKNYEFFEHNLKNWKTAESIDWLQRIFGPNVKLD